ncbi:Uncharacterised protein [Streptococcus pneumoniae]|nr:Uncharacterised protein [Streptococcus pneumoniae]
MVFRLGVNNWGYLIEAHFASNQDLATFLDGIENFASYQVASSVNQII